MAQDVKAIDFMYLPWKESLDQVEQLSLKPEAKRKLLRDNAVELFPL